MSQDQASAAKQVAKNSQEQQLNRACEPCRLSKVRCLVNTTSASSQCQRCAKGGRACVFAPPAKRRQRKRTDMRVAELEKEVKQMQLLLRSNQISPVQGSADESMDEESEELEEQEDPTYQWDVRTTPPVTAPPSSKWLPSHASPSDTPSDSLLTSDADIIDRQVITKELAQELLNMYRDELALEYPGVVIPKDWTARDLRTRKPALFLAVVAAASHSKGAALSDRLHEEVMYFYAKSVFLRGEKALQYIQALLITVAYYTPPNSPAHLQIYQLGNLAASMALELGMAYKPRTHEQLPKRAIRALQKISSPEELLENCRTILVLYTMTAGFAMRLRRPSILNYNSWMEEALSLLQKSPLLDDRRVVAWVKLQRIADEANTAFGFDDASTSFSLSELRLQVILRIFERRMQDWKRSIPPEVLNLSLEVEHYQNLISIWEFAMDGGRYDAPDFRNRHLTLPALDDDSIQPETLLSRSALQINATIKVVSTAHSLLDCFAALSGAQLRQTPSAQFVRAMYALVALMKADYAVGTDAEGMGEVLDSQSLKVDFYLAMVVRKAREAVGPQKCRVPSHWLFVLEQKLKTWHDEHQQWRKEGRHLKRPKDDGTTAGPGTSSSFNIKSQDTPATIQHLLSLVKPPSSQTQTQTQTQLPTYTINPYPTWPSSTAPNTSTSFASLDSTMAVDQANSTTNLGDFSDAFQNGDLYLWNEVNDSMGGWFQQGGGIYGDNMEFGTFGDQGV
ncbi:hypothetical protein BDV95DRAFT_502118 [Massariosphaeria phaeospora]|uniref:Zn(2)-C6 fungal-type domain-containing protein n=1 Tax=Massariosphaeria phaeospora TaxID=100035 RepID=A0A7C8I9C6_9PLEO|nr:hypothetical protein BDV95DRAFT_502118 [Massariosphaeria phaeospora]